MNGLLKDEKTVVYNCSSILNLFMAHADADPYVFH